MHNWWAERGAHNKRNIPHTRAESCKNAQFESWLFPVTCLELFLMGPEVSQTVFFLIRVFFQCKKWW